MGLDKSYKFVSVVGCLGQVCSYNKSFRVRQSICAHYMLVFLAEKASVYQAAHILVRQMDIPDIVHCPAIG